MKILVRTKQIDVDENLRAHIERRLQFGLGRFSRRIRRVIVQIVDINGPRGGEDKVCRIEVRLPPTGSVFIEDRDADLYAAVDRAADRAARSVARAIKRAQDLERDVARPERLPGAPAPADTDEQPAA